MSTFVSPRESVTNRPPSSAMPLRMACLEVSESVVLRVLWNVVTGNPCVAAEWDEVRLKSTVRRGHGGGGYRILAWTPACVAAAGHVPPY